jgi:hypothetical protein
MAYHDGIWHIIAISWRMAYNSITYNVIISSTYKFTNTNIHTFSNKYFGGPIQVNKNANNNFGA